MRVPKKPNIGNYKTSKTRTHHDLNTSNVRVNKTCETTFMESEIQNSEIKVKLHSSQIEINNSKTLKLNNNTPKRKHPEFDN